MGNHLECYLEFLKVFNGDKMASIGVLHVIKNPTKLFGLRNSLVLKSPLFNNVIFLYIWRPSWMLPIFCLFSCAYFKIQLIQLSNTSDPKRLPKYDYFPRNCCFPYTGSHLGRHVEFLNLLNGDKMSPAGFLM